jgi:predicted nucleotide-binding protein
MSVYYHIRVSTKSNPYLTEYRFDQPLDGLGEQFLLPYQEGRPLTVNGRVIEVSDVTRITITRSEEPSRELRNLARTDRRLRSSSLSEDWQTVDKGEDVTNEFIKGPPGGQLIGHVIPKDVGTEDAQTVFVVHGRNTAARDAMFAFLRSIGLKPLEWIEAARATGKPAPYIGEVLDKAFALARAVVVLMTPDDEARLLERFRGADEPDYEIKLTPQARANVLFEAGMAMGRSANRTVLVEVGTIRPFSDIGGRHVLRLNDSTERRQEFADRLELAGCPVNLKGTDWHRAGDFV